MAYCSHVLLFKKEEVINYKNSNFIINPDILEPVVQYVYTLQVKYTLEKPDIKTKNNYLMVSPTGEIKKLDIKD